MSKQKNKSKKYSEKYFLNDLPPTHNPLIGMMYEDTLCNVRNSLCALKEITESPDFAASKQAINGYHILTSCMVEALNFELYFRKPKTQTIK